jgi:threonine 3-dehydrogenase
MAKMTALMKTKPERGAELKQVDVPTPGDSDLLVRVEKAAICGTDNHIYEWTAYASSRCTLPMIFGHEYCGEVVEVGGRVSAFAPGDKVAAETHIPCGHCYQCQTGRQHTCESMKIIGVHTEGAFSEYAVLPEACAWKLAPGTSADLGAVLEPMGVAMNGLMKDRVGGCNIAVFGCGPIGIFASQLAWASGANRLFATDINPYRIDLARKVVPDAMVIDASKTDAVAAILEATAGRGVDVSVELTGTAPATRQAFQVLRKGGRISLVGLPSDPIALDMTDSIIYREAVVYGSTGRLMWDTWWQMDQILAQGRIDPTKVITHQFPLARFDEALQLTISGRSGKVLLIP